MSTPRTLHCESSIFPTEIESYRSLTCPVHSHDTSIISGTTHSRIDYLSALRVCGEETENSHLACVHVSQYQCLLHLHLCSVPRLLDAYRCTIHVPYLLRSRERARLRLSVRWPISLVRLASWLGAQLDASRGRLILCQYLGCCA